jgi:hypothetical protein
MVRRTIHRSIDNVSLEEYALLMTKYESEYNRNVDCMVKTDALHDHIRLLSETLAEKEINEEKLVTQHQQMKKLMTLFVSDTPSVPISQKKSNEKSVRTSIPTRSMSSAGLF